MANHRSAGERQFWLLIGPPGTHLAWVIKCYHLNLAIHHPVFPTAFRFPNSETTDPPIRYGIKKKTITELFKDAEATLKS